MSRLKNNKALGNQWLSAELLRGHQDIELYQALADLLNGAFENGFPAPWNTVAVRNLFKKGDPANPANYRGISLMGVLPKLVAQAILSRLEAAVEAGSLRAVSQAGFRTGARLEDHVVVL